VVPRRFSASSRFFPVSLRVRVVGIRTNKKSSPHFGHLSLTIPSNPSVHSSSLNPDGHDDSPLTNRQPTYGYLTPISPGDIQTSPLTPPDINGGGIPFPFNYPPTSGYTLENAMGPVPITPLEPQGGSFSSGGPYRGIVPPVITPCVCLATRLFFTSLTLLFVQDTDREQPSTYDNLLLGSVWTAHTPRPSLSL
jgi:hypothetical protein